MKIILFFISAFVFTNMSSQSLALDLDDGIGIDDSINKYHEMGKIGQNVKYIALNSISKAYTTMDTDKTEGLVERPTAVNSVILAPGSEVQGDIIIIDQSAGSNTAISK
ncbi:MAG: hypothetical protein D3924_00730 [Candidatus Electrothrix sp. AR4]|nr:hypothetical protein [Candidatus Electrothrix sp. AR4]